MGSNYLIEVLSSEDGHIANVTSKISELLSHANNLKVGISTVIQDKSTQFTHLLKENNSFIVKSNNLLKELSAVHDEIEGGIKNELSSCEEDLKSLSSSLIEVKLFLEILEELFQINTLVREAKERMQKKEFYECAKSVTAAQTLIKSKSEELKSVEIFKLLSEEVNSTYEELIKCISGTFLESILIIRNMDGLDNMKHEIVNIGFHSDLNQVLNASSVLKPSFLEKEFSQSLLKYILKEVILKKTQISTKTDGNEEVLEVKVHKTSPNPSYSEVFNNLKLIFEFLKSHLGIQLEDGSNYLSKIGCIISNEFVDFLIKNCLTETIPTSSSDLDQYKVVVEEFENSLQEVGFLPNNSTSLGDYAKNVNVFFASKFCQSYLYKARIIMKKDLHNAGDSEGISTNINILPTTYRKILKEKLNVQDEILSFPKCRISKQAEELMTLTHSMIKEIENSSDLCAVRLFFTIRNIFEMYSAVVPLHHKKFLETLPLQVALFHNNCIYFTHSLINLVTKYYNKIPCIQTAHFNILLEEAIVLRSVAAETLEATVTNLRNNHLFALRSSGFATLNENPDFNPNAELVIRQCICQLKILQNVWNDVLPSNVYNRAIGFLLDTITEELINLILATEDISSHTANDLVLCFKIILEQAPSLFPDSKEIHKHSKKFLRFQEFVLVLKGNLRDIDDRWADGMGPLANEFTPEQVKHLIRALFQNSKRRSLLLAKIKLR